MSQPFSVGQSGLWGSPSFPIRGASGCDPASLVGRPGLWGSPSLQGKSVLGLWAQLDFVAVLSPVSASEVGRFSFGLTHSACVCVSVLARLVWCTVSVFPACVIPARAAMVKNQPLEGPETAPETGPSYGHVFGHWPPSPHCVRTTFADQQRCSEHGTKNRSAW